MTLPLSDLDVNGIKLEIINAAEVYAEAMVDLAMVSGKLPMKDKLYQKRSQEARKAFTNLYAQINKLDVLKEGK